MARPRTIPFEKEKFKLSERNKKTVELFAEPRYKLRVSRAFILYAFEGRKSMEVDDVQIKAEYHDWFKNQFK